MAPCNNCKKVLIVDDDAFNVMTLKLLFKKFGFICSKAYNGSEAVELIINGINLLSKNKTNCNCIFTLVIMDYQMPVMDGGNILLC